MNKQIIPLTVLLLVLLTGCNQITIDNPVPKVSDLRNELDDAIITKSVKDNCDYSVSLEEARLFACCQRDEEVKSVQSISVKEGALLYICNYENGWMVIAGDKRAKPILAESPIGQLNIDNAPEGIKVWIEVLADDMLYFKEESSFQDKSNTNIWSLFSPIDKQSAAQPEGRSVMKWYAINSVPTVTVINEYDEVPHLIPTKWGQGFPWNVKCPIDLSCNNRCYLGCTATAVAQLLFYTHFNFSKPNRLYHTIGCTYLTINSETTNIGFYRNDMYAYSNRWNDMALNQYGTTTGIEYAGDLMLDIGNRFNMKYSGEGSGANMHSYAMSNYYDLSYSSCSYDYSIVNTNLNDSIPVIVIAYSDINFLGIPSSGHTWLIDGKHCITRSYTYTKEFEYSENWIYYDEVYDTFDEIHQIYHIQDPSEQVEIVTTGVSSYLLMNWGYDGAYDNAYYSIGANDNWNANGGNHLYSRTIYYGFH